MQTHKVNNEYKGRNQSTRKNLSRIINHLNLEYYGKIYKENHDQQKYLMDTTTQLIPQ
jgi:hypothetical protein